MSVIAIDASNQRRVFDEDAKNFAYKVEASGALTILVAGNDLRWSVLSEFSPAGWLEVQGTRYTTDTDKREGTEGKAAHKSTPMQVF